jgi:hypothetical protein
MFLIWMDRSERINDKAILGSTESPRLFAVPTCIAAFGVGRGIFESPILNQFGIQTTIGRVVDVLEEHANQHIADGFVLFAEP